MAILNVTPDSFSDGGRYPIVGDAVDAALDMVARGASIIDVGGESTGPGATPIHADEECHRVVPVVEALRARSSVVISVDTTKAVVARAAVAAGADIINDVSGMSLDPAMPALCARTRAGCLVMHSPGTPDVMDGLATYHDVVAEVGAWLAARVAALEAAGVDRAAIAIDPGFGFGKTPSQNDALLHALPSLTPLDLPVWVGVSRKRMIRARVGTSPYAVEHGTTAANTIAMLGGASCIRVHDVEAAVAAASTVDLA